MAVSAAAGEPSGTPGEDVLRFIERFAMALADFGLPRMAARVFAYILIDDAERYTAADLASGLRVSPAAISGAVRTLVQANLIGKEREPGARVDTYRIYDDDVWGTIMSRRVDTVEPFEQLAGEGVELLGADRRGGRRLRETQEFYAFMRRKLAENLDEWREHRQALFGEGAQSAEVTD
ncbi:MarR family transcriptional regulator [Haloechinothrix sp. YIM 98757]|uniref:MarR family transcriptional regulator n=2 Tax=Haloechinothrix aidingensis TaxID=2752311 RepID=A0A838AFS6_9PSEU|nr:MarR family transcriptional regulator [Haloechinothrix aidingensis]